MPTPIPFQMPVEDLDELNDESQPLVDTRMSDTNFGQRTSFYEKTSSISHVSNSKQRTDNAQRADLTVSTTAEGGGNESDDQRDNKEDSNLRIVSKKNVVQAVFKLQKQIQKITKEQEESRKEHEEYKKKQELTVTALHTFVQQSTLNFAAQNQLMKDMKDDIIKEVQQHQKTQRVHPYQAQSSTSQLTITIQHYRGCYMEQTLANLRTVASQYKIKRKNFTTKRKIIDCLYAANDTTYLTS
jgi:hypothetical protein